jgi:hypothetical protein
MLILAMVVAVQSIALESAAGEGARKLLQMGNEGKNATTEEGYESYYYYYELQHLLLLQVTLLIL